MSDVVIHAEGVGKQYRIGEAQAPYKSLRESLVAGAKHLRPGRVRPHRRADDELFWALKDVSFTVSRGEAVGIIGRNGAGKSTLLKVLSRITEPTVGTIDIYGRVGSLLEVGTGFHPELTGRENIYLSGAILGMKRVEIDRRFDEIVSFAEVERFIDTPVKRFSSGMYLRLAFAVAAHLEPEILLVDEVLAVGDAAFQKKCLGKMGDVAGEGRTVLFVSHNMAAVQALCSQSIRLREGRLADSGATGEVIARYLAESSGSGNERVWAEEEAPGTDEVRLLSIRVSSSGPPEAGTFSSGEDIYVDMAFNVSVLHASLCVGFDLFTSMGQTVTRAYQTDLAPDDWPRVVLGTNRWRCTIPSGLLNAGPYEIAPRISMHSMYWIVNSDPVVQFDVVLGHGISPFWNTLGNVGSRPGVVAPLFQWTELDAGG